MTIIAAITIEHGLGEKGKMLYAIPEDLKRFKALTMGHPIIMGRKTFESFPNGPLPGRRNMVLTHNPEYSHPGIETFPSLEAALAACGDEEPFIIGGQEIYYEAMPLADRMLITHIHTLGIGADTYFPPIDALEWRIVSQSEWFTDPKTGLDFMYRDYRRN